VKLGRFPDENEVAACFERYYSRHLDVREHRARLTAPVDAFT
jgi:hypothetical protein